MDEAEGLDKIEELQNHSHEDIYDKAVLILETFFDVEDGEAENLAPQVRACEGGSPRAAARRTPATPVPQRLQPTAASRPAMICSSSLGFCTWNECVAMKRLCTAQVAAGQGQYAFGAQPVGGFNLGQPQ